MESNMDYEKATVDFLDKQMSGDYADVMDKFLMLDIDWLEAYDGEQLTLRGWARMGDFAGNNEYTESNIIVLFPPFYPFKDK